MSMPDLSIDNELAKVRLSELMESATPKQKMDITGIAMLVNRPIHRVCATGKIPIIVATAVARELNVDPFYLTGEAGKPGEYTKENTTSFLIAKGYSEFADENYIETTISEREYDKDGNLIAVWYNPDPD